MRNLPIGIACAWSLVVTTACGFEDGQQLFNGRDLDGWSFQVRKGEEKVLPVEEVWVVRNGLLISTGACTGFLKHRTEFDNYMLTLEYRSMQINGNGVAVGGSGSVFVHTSNKEGPFNYPESVEVAVFNDTGSVYLRDVDRFSDKEWAFRASDVVDDVEKDMEEWNKLQVICRGPRLTVLLNGTPVNQVDGLSRTRGAIALQSQGGGFIRAPSFYRNIRVEPLGASAIAAEATASRQLAEFKAAAEKRAAAQEAKRDEADRREKMQQEKFTAQWATIDVSPEIPFEADVLKLPFPEDAEQVEFDPGFEDVDLVSRMSMAELSRFYRTEMARRGWDEKKKERDDDSVNVTFRNGKARVALRLSKNSDSVDASLDCRGLSFARTRDPAQMAATGFAQPEAYLFLQREITLPANARDLEFDGGNRCLFKSDQTFAATFASLGQQLRGKGYRESRRPIVTGNRRYTEYKKGRVEVSVNVFEHNGGSRVILTCKGI